MPNAVHRQIPWTSIWHSVKWYYLYHMTNVTISSVNQNKKKRADTSRFLNDLISYKSAKMYVLKCKIKYLMWLMWLESNYQRQESDGKCNAWNTGRLHLIVEISLPKIWLLRNTNLLLGSQGILNLVDKVHGPPYSLLISLRWKPYFFKMALELALGHLPSTHDSYSLVITHPYMTRTFQWIELGFIGFYQVNAPIHLVYSLLIDFHPFNPVQLVCWDQGC